MGDDASIVQAARVSYGKGTKSVSEDRALIRYLLRHKHTSVFEQAIIKIHVKCPIFVARQWLRHRTWSYNELSLRYSEASDEMFSPEIDTIKQQSKLNKQGGDQQLTSEESYTIKGAIEGVCQSSMAQYSGLVNKGLAREMARVVLPVAAYTEFYATVDIHNLMHFLALRMKPAAQYEIRVFANALFEILSTHFPMTAEAFEEYVYKSYTLSGPEIHCLWQIMQGLDWDSLDTKGMGKNEKESFRKFITERLGCKADAS
jgi:thymidylate synthase (FAD)